VPTPGRWRGLLVAGAVVASWLLSVGLGLSAPDLGWPQGLLLVALSTFLSTGLFITAHDAMHGLVLPGSSWVNHAVGQLALGLYAGFAFEPLRRSHGRHHQAPASAEDPDFHDGRRTGFGPWYLHFMRHYLSLGQVLRMAVGFNLLAHLGGISQLRLLAFWVAPALLSTVQLFYFGTYRPHRLPEGGYRDAHRATSNDFPVWLSFLTCFHFGYHHEHHANPAVPWWGLPGQRGALSRGPA
jgi:beta-carotene ketolase (CrtW type)